MSVQVEFDPAKDTKNRKAHGVSLALAEDLEWDLLVSREDTTRFDYAELRMKGFAPIGSTLYCIVYIERQSNVIRAISLRRATKQEVKSYAEEIRRY